MKRHIGKLLGTLIGALIGRNLFGTAIGFLIGYFFDVLIAERAIRAEAADPLASGILKPYERFIAALTGLCMYVVRCGEQGNPKKGERRNSRIVGWIVAEALKLNGKELERLDLFIRGFRTAETIDFIPLAAVYSEATIDEGERLLMEVLFAVAEEALGDQKHKLAAIKRIADTLGIDTAVYTDILHSEGEDIADAYAILGLPEGADIDEVKRVYRTLALYFHPDSTGTLSQDQREKAGEAFLKIQEAYERILHEEEKQN